MNVAETLKWKEITRNCWLAEPVSGAQISVSRNPSWKRQGHDKPWRIKIFGNVHGYSIWYAEREEAQHEAERLLREIVCKLVAWAEELPELPAWIDAPFVREGGGWPEIPWLVGLSVRADNAIHNAAGGGFGPVVFHTTREMIAQKHTALLGQKNLGKKTLREIVDVLAEHGVEWPAKGRPLQ